jgi:hypothetical protein
MESDNFAELFAQLESKAGSHTPRPGLARRHGTLL